MFMEIALWIVLLVFCIIAEVATSVALVTIWFMPGAIIAAILAAFRVSIVVQIIVFLIVSIISLFITKEIVVKKRLAKQFEQTNINSLIGKSAKLQDDCSAYKKSSIKVGDVVWSVKTLEDDLLEAGTIVKVVSVEGNTLIVKKGD